jgi:hypothetical protein
MPFLCMRGSGSINVFRYSRFTGMLLSRVAFTGG